MITSTAFKKNSAISLERGPSGGYERSIILLEESAKAAVLGIDPTQQFAFVKPKADGVIGLPRAGLPSRGLAGKNKRQSAKIGDNVPINRLVEGKQSGLVGQELPNCDRLTSRIVKLHPVSGKSSRPTHDLGDRAPLVAVLI